MGLPKAKLAGGSGQEILRSGGIVFGKNFCGSVMRLGHLVPQPTFPLAASRNAATCSRKAGKDRTISKTIQGVAVRGEVRGVCESFLMGDDCRNHYFVTQKIF